MNPVIQPASPPRCSPPLGLAGCSLERPYSPRADQRTRRSARPDAPDPAPERGGTIPAAAQAAQLPSPRRRPAHPAGRARPLRHVAVNWNWRDLAAAERRLATLSLGPARAQALQAAAHAAADTTLRQQRIRNAGRAVSIAPASASRRPLGDRHPRAHPGDGSYAGLPPTLNVTYAQLTRTPNGWVVRQWQPQT